jgi:hypothetical protein
MVPKVVSSSSDKNQHGLVHVHVPHAGLIIQLYTYKYKLCATHAKKLLINLLKTPIEVTLQNK